LLVTNFGDKNFIIYKRCSTDSHLVRLAHVYYQAPICFARSLASSRSTDYDIKLPASHTSRLSEKYGSEVLVGDVRNTDWPAITDCDPCQSGGVVIRQQDHPHRVPAVVHGQSRSDQRRHWTGSKRRPPARL